MYSGLSTDAETIIRRIDAVVKNLEFMYSTKADNTTPFALCLQVVDNCVDFKNFNQTIIDPVVGKGSFVLALIKRFLENGCSLDKINSIIHAHDISSSQIQHTNNNIYKATGMELSNVGVGNSMSYLEGKKFDCMVGNFPFNDDSASKGRDTNKVKENTGDLDYQFYLEMLDKAKSHAVIMRAGCLSKKSKVRESIFSDKHVHTIMNTTNYFDVSPSTMCVFRNEDTATDIKTFIDKNGDLWKYKTNKDTKLSINMTVDTISTVNKVIEKCEIENFGMHWLRAPVLRSDEQVNKDIGIPFVQITGAKDVELEIEKYAGDATKFKSLDKWKVISNVNASNNSIGNIKIVPPGVATSNSIVYFPFDTEEQAIEAKAYLESDFVKFITPIFKSSAGNSSEFFLNIPYTDFTNKEKLEELYQIYEQYKEHN